MKKALLPVFLLVAAFPAAGPLMAVPNGAGFYDTSEYMIGSISVNIIFPESDGSIKPQTETWSDYRKGLVVDQIHQAMNWWAAREPRAKLTFVYSVNTVPTGYEPINCYVNPANGTNPCTEELWVNNVMSNLGYNSVLEDEFERVYHYDNDMRAANGTDWAITIFVADSNNDPDDAFADNYFAYAYLGGPFMVMTYDNAGYGIANLGAVAAHEMGHLFYALDEYYDAATSPCSTTEETGYYDVQNTNCEHGGTAFNCIMRGDTPPYYSPAICDATKKMLGWQDLNTNNILDLADFPPTTELTAYSPDPTATNTPVYNGIARTVAAYANHNPYTTSTSHYWYTSAKNNITVLKVTGVDFKIDPGGSWQTATAKDGAFGQSIESFTFTTSALGDNTYTFWARAKNSFDVYDPAPPSDVLTINTLNPTDIPFVNDGLAGDIDYVSSHNTLSANWGQSYHASGINHYEYAIGTTPGGVNVKGWTSIGLAQSVTYTVPGGLTENTTYYFSAKAQNNNFLYSGVSSSDGQLVDTISPTARVEISSVLPAKTGQLNLKLIVSDVNGFKGTPVLTFTPSGGSPQPVTLSYLTASTWTGTAFIESFYSTGTASFGFSGTDPADNAGTSLTSGGSFLIDTAVSGAGGGTVVNHDNSSVILPPGAYSGNLLVSISTIPVSRTALADAAGSEARALTASDLTREFLAETPGGTHVTSFSAPVTITLCYPDANNDGRIDGDNISVSLARVYWLDETASRWTRVEGAVQNPVTHCLSAQTSHFSVYSIRVLDTAQYGLDSLKAFPNPCYFDRAPSVLTIRGIPIDAQRPEIYIYNSAGELVRELKQGDGIDGFANEGVWNGRQKNGAKAASGLYLYLVKTGNYGKATGKFYIFW